VKTKIVFLSVLFCVALIFQGCGAEIDNIAKNYPKIDGSTSSLPIVQEIYKAIFKPETIDGEEVWSGLPMSASKTIESYKLLIDGEVDMIIVSDPSEEVKALAAEKGVELEYTPICLEALVFINSGVRPLPLGMGIQAAYLGHDICEFFKNNRKDA